MENIPRLRCSSGFWNGIPRLFFCGDHEKHPAVTLLLPVLVTKGAGAQQCGHCDIIIFGKLYLPNQSMQRQRCPLAGLISLSSGTVVLKAWHYARLLIPKIGNYKGGALIIFSVKNQVFTSPKAHFK